MKVKKITSETSYVLNKVSPRLNSSAVVGLMAAYTESDRRRHRYCFHQNPDVSLHDIVIVYDEKSYIPPNKHIGKSESLLVLNGCLDFFIFSDDGRVIEYRRLGSIGTQYPFYVRVPPNTWHGLRAVGSDPCIIKETISGPYDRSTLLWGDFAPNEAVGVDEGVRWYDEVSRKCRVNSIVQPADEVFERVSDTLFRSSRQLLTVGRAQLEPIVAASHRSPLRRARLLCHMGPEDKLQEMFISLAAGVDIEESVHIRKDESLTVVSGNAEYVFPNEDGSVRDVAPLGPYDSEMCSDDFFFARINRFVPHKIVVPENEIVIHEATTGPFIKEDTAYRLKWIDQ
jgi:cupin fold WbuC family metalloprotein